MKVNELHDQPVKPDTYEAGMALNQLLKIGTHAIKIHNMIDDNAEMESWVAKKIDLASNYVKSVHGYTAGSKAGTYDDGGLTEDAPFDGMSLLRMAIMRKFITVQEWDLLKHKWKDAVEELEQRYDDWPEDQGFGSSDHAYAIKELMELVGYEFDGQDTSGRFVITKQPEEIEKAGIKNVRMRDAVTTDSLEARLETKLRESREQIGDYAREIKTGRIVRIVDYTDDDEGIYTISYGEDKGENDVTAKDLKFLDQTGGDQEEIGKFDEDANNLETAYKQIAMLANNVKKEPTDADDQMDVADDVARPITKILSTIMDYTKGEQMPDGSASKTTYVDMYKKLGMLANKGAQTNDPKVAPLLFKMMSSIYDMDKVSEGSIQEDAGEGHMSKSQLYQTAKMAIELLDMIKKGDDLEGWVQTKLNLAADYLQAVYHYEDYQKLNPYREEIDSSLMQRHAGIIQKHLDEILSKETNTRDVDTKPGMMKILKKRVNEVEKEIAKENRKETDEVAPPGREKQVKKLKGKFKDKGAPYAIAWAQHNKHGKPNNEAELEEGIKDWAKNLAMAGVVVAGLAGVGSIQDAIDRSVPAVQAMETALELAQDQGNTELADMIEKDLSAVKVRLSSGKDLNFVKGMQEKYSKFVKTEGLAYESKLAIMLNQQLK